MVYPYKIVDYLALLVYLVLPIPTIAQAPVRFEHLTVKDGLSDNRIF